MKNSASALKTWSRCHKLWELTYVQKKEPLDSGSFEMSYGTSFHGLLEGDLEPIKFFGDKWQGVITAHYNAYRSYWKARSEFSLEYVQHEVPFEFELIPGVILHGYLDGVVRLDGQYYIVESKTTGGDIAPGSRYWTYKENDLQVGVYLLAAKHCESLQQYNIAGVVYDVTRRPSIRQKRSEDDQGYVERCTEWLYDNRASVFVRDFMDRSEEQLDDLASDIIAISEEQERTKLFVKNRDACYMFNKLCGFSEHCFGGEPLSNTNLFQERKRR